MWLMKTHIEEEGFGLLTSSKPALRLISHEVCGVAGQFADRSAVADEVVGIVMVRVGVVLRGEPVIETVIVGLRLSGLVEFSVHVPFAYMAGGVA